MAKEGELLWTPSPEFARSSNLARYQEWLRVHRGRAFAGYDELWRWSVDELEEFWASIWEYFDVRSATPYRKVLSARVMPGASWFEGARVNYAEHVLRHEEAARPDEVALHHRGEARPAGALTWRELGRQVRTLATELRGMGVRPGDRVASYLPNVPEAIVAMLATTAVGAVWSSAAPDFGVPTVIDRFAQIAPKVLFAVDGYRFAGRDYRRDAEVGEIVARLPSVERVIRVSVLGSPGQGAAVVSSIRWEDLMARPEVPREAFRYERVEHDHPLWVVFSSGTTGLPKAIVHGHVGILLDHLRLLHLHCGLRPGSAMFFYTSTGWMMWNVLASSLLCGAAAVLYDGNPVHPDAGCLWRIAEETGTTYFGASASFVQTMDRLGFVPSERHDLSRLEGTLVGGSPVTPPMFEWFYRNVKRDLWFTSQSGGTETCSCLVTGVPTLPVYAGEIQARALGIDLHAWSDNGREILDAVGEMVVTSPFPSMPIRFWNDADGRRYRESYFEPFPGVWRHGDFIRINARGGCYIDGRSDSTLNRHGVRIGTAEVYRVVEQVEGVADSLVVCCNDPDGSFYMPLFVEVKPGAAFDAALVERIEARLRRECSPRHVPDEILQVDAIPYTLTGKKMEVPVRKILMGWPPEKAASRDAMSNPGALDHFARLAAARGRTSGGPAASA